MLFQRMRYIAGLLPYSFGSRHPVMLCCLLLPVVFYCSAHCEQLCYMADRDTKVMM